MNICGVRETTDEVDANRLRLSRFAWCRTNHVKSGSCEAFFVDFETTRRAAWRMAREDALNGLPIIDLSQNDLRSARMREVRLENARLIRTRFSEADLRRANLEGADLRRARMLGANLLDARLEGANLIGARLDRAILRRTRFDEGADLTNAKTRQAVVREMDLTRIEIDPGQIQSMFGDGSVILPSSVDRPEFWPIVVLDWLEFREEWLTWMDNPDAYRPPRVRNRAR